MPNLAFVMTHYIFLKIKCKVLTLLTKKIYFTLIMNVVAIRKQLEFDGIYHHGYVNFGVGFNCETVKKASEYFFFFFSCSY